MFDSEIQHVMPSIRVDHLGAIATREHYTLRWTYNGRRDDTDCYGVSAHDTLRGARIAQRNRERATNNWE